MSNSRNRPYAPNAIPAGTGTRRSDISLSATALVLVLVLVVVSDRPAAA